MLHVRCGDDVIPELRAAALPGRVVRWTIAACCGPLGPWPARRSSRAQWLASLLLHDPSQIEADFVRQDAELRAAVVAGEPLVFWCESDPWDVSDMVAAVATADSAMDTEVELVMLDEWPGIEPFYGLVQLSPSQLAQAFEDRITLDPGQRSELRRAWDAMCSGPTAMAALGAESLRTPGLAGALARLGEEAPDSSGLGRTERQLVTSAATRPRAARECYAWSQQQERRAWLGDSMAFAMIDALASRANPVIAVDPPGAVASNGAALVRGV